MPLQSPRLSMYAIGVTGDAPSDAIRHKLVDGVHLRWVFEKRLGFPRHGFHLFRRRSAVPERQCLRPALDPLPPGSLGATQRDTPLGRIGSDVDLRLTDEFGWRWSRVVWGVGPVGLDLDGRTHLRLALPQPARTDGSAPLGVEVQVGLRENHGVVGERVEFWRRAPGSGPNPLVEKSIAFRVLDPVGIPRDRTEITVDDRDHPLSQLDVAMGSASVLEASLPLPASAVFLRLTSVDGSIEGFSADGRRIGSQSWRFAEGSFLTAVSFLPGEPVIRVVMRGVTALQTFTFETTQRTGAGIVVKALHGDVEVARALTQGLERQVIRQRLTADAPISAVEIEGGPGVLADLCLLAPGREGVTHGWEKLPGFRYPLALPVTHPDYEGSGSRPVDDAAAQAEALGRIRYGPPDPWSGTGFDDLHAQLLALVEGGPEPAMVTRSALVPGTPRTPRAGPEETIALRRYPLDSVLLATLHPAVAQMVGLAWVDQAVQPGVSYDYLLLAEWRPAPSPEFASRDPDAVLAKLRRDGVADTDAFIILGRRLEPPDAPPAPARPEAYALPGGTIQTPNGTLARAENVTGLRWQLDRSPSGRLGVRAPVLHHLWRADLGDDPGGAAPAADRYRCLTVGRPLVIVRAPPGTQDEVQQSSAWPPFRLHAIDGGLAEGWYSYQVSGLDLFGRHGGRSAAAGWRQWAPVPDPRPWYYQDPPGDREQHPFAVRQADRIPPPPPAAIGASALDPADPLLLRDAAYEAWRASLTAAERKTLVGLRMRWEWPEALRRQAPDLREFRIYLQPGRLNAVGARVRSVEPAGPQESLVELDGTALPSPAAVVGAVLQVAGRDYPVLEAGPGPPWRARVGGVPAAPAPCALVFPPGHALHADHRAARAWRERWYVVGVDEHFAAGTGPDGRPVRRYEVLLPAPGDPFRGGLEQALAPSAANPVAYAAVGVSAADDRTQVPDAPQWATGRWGGRTGNEGAVGPPAAVFRVRREPPRAPEPAPDSERSFATPADYAGRSFYTYRWRPAAHLSTHVFRALDDALFATDRGRRFDAAGAPRPDQPTLDPDEAGIFPGGWSDARRAQAADEINQLNAVADRPAYDGLSNDSQRVLAGLPDNDRAFSQLTIQPLDPDDPANANRLGPDNPSDFPVDPGLRAYLDTLDGRAANRYFYRAAYVDGAHNRGPLGLSSAPVWLPDVAAPRTPLPAGVTGGDGEVVLRWASNREPDLVRYAVYRADTAAQADDLRLMNRVGIVNVAAGPPSARLPEVEYRDATVVPYIEYIYRITAVDASGNESPPSAAAVARAYSTLPLEPPAAAAAGWVGTGDARAVRVTWTPVPGVAVLVQRRTVGATAWRTVGTWSSPAARALDDPGANRLEAHEYRVRARDPSGRISEAGAALAVAPDV